MNIEFVYLILTGIIYNIKVTDNKRSDSSSTFSDTQMTKQKKDTYNAVSIIKYTEMRMSVSDWDVDNGASLRSSVSSAHFLDPQIEN